MGSEKWLSIRLLAKVKGQAGSDVFLHNIGFQDLNFNPGVAMFQFLYTVFPLRED